MFGGRGALGRAQDMREMKRREKDAAKEDVMRYYVEQRTIDVASKSWTKDELKRREREARERQMEKETIEKMIKDHANQQIADIRKMEENRIADTLAKQYTEQQRKDREIQALREQSEELRELAEKIRTARVNKERFLQKREREILVRKDKQYHQLYDQMMEKQRATALERERIYLEKKREDNLESRRVLEEQMQEKADARKNAQLEYDREKALIDEVVRRIEEEDALETEIKRTKQAETKAFIAEFLEDREELRQEKIRKEREEDARIAQYLESVQEREGAEQARKQAVQDEANQIYNRLCKEKEEEEMRQEEEARLLDMLREEEAEQKRRLEISERLRKAELAKQDMMKQNEQQMRLKAEREAARKQEEEEFRRRMLDKFAEDDRIDQLNAQRRRQKQIEHRHEVDRLIEEKRVMYEEMKLKEARDEASRQEEEQRKAAIIEKERKKLLEEAAALTEFLPKGVIRDKTEKEYVEKLVKQTQNTRLE